MSRTEISTYINRYFDEDEKRQLLEELKRQDLVVYEQQRPPMGGGGLESLIIFAIANPEVTKAIIQALWLAIETVITRPTFKRGAGQKPPWPDPPSMAIEVRNGDRAVIASIPIDSPETGRLAANILDSAINKVLDSEADRTHLEFDREKEQWHERYIDPTKG